MKRFSSLFLLVTLLLYFSCDTDDVAVVPACGVTNPIEDLSWLRNEVARREANITEFSKFCFIVQAVANAETIFLYEDCDPLADKFIPVFDCDGTAVGRVGDENYPLEAITMREIIYRPSDFSCSF